MNHKSCKTCDELWEIYEEARKVYRKTEAAFYESVEAHAREHEEAVE